MSDKVKLISEWYVRPEMEINTSKKHYNLNSSDINLLLLSYIQWIYLFQKPHNFSPKSFIDNLKLSLSKALVQFYPLAGQFVTQMYKNEHNYSCSIYIDCHKGVGAKLVHAEAVDLTIDCVLPPKDDIPNIIRSFLDVDAEDLINYDGHTKPLLSVQVTELSDGVIIGLCLNHSVADGTSFLNFLKVWSQIYMEPSLSSSSSSPSSSSINDMPVVDGNRMMIKLPYRDDEFMMMRVHHHHHHHHNNNSKMMMMRERIFHFTSSAIALLKAKANAEADDDVISSISSLQAFSAFVWRCITRARRSGSTQRTVCALMANLRPRLDPPLSQGHFGNFLTAAIESVEVGELLGNSLGWAALLLHRAVAGLDKREAREGASESVPEIWIPGLKSLGDNPVLIAGSPRLDVYGGVEFGLGRARAVHTGFHSKDGNVTAFPGAEGDGSVNLQICLASKTMGLLLSDDEFMSFASDWVTT